MFCIKCGKEITKEMKHCPYCGNEVAYNELTNENNLKLSKQKKPKRKGRKFLIFGVIIAILVVMGVVLICVGSKSDEVRTDYRYKETVIDIDDYNIPKVTDKLSVKDWEGVYYNRLNNLILILYKNDDDTMSVNIAKNGSFTPDNFDDYLVISDATGKFDDEDNHILVSEVGLGDYRFEMELIDPEVGVMDIHVNDIDTGVWWYYADEDTSISELNAYGYDIFTSYSEIEQIEYCYGDTEEDTNYSYKDNSDYSSTDEDYYETNDVIDNYEVDNVQYTGWCEDAIQVYEDYYERYTNTGYYNGAYLREDGKIVFLSYQDGRDTHSLAVIDTQTGNVIIDTLVLFDPYGTGESLFWLVNQDTGEDIITFEYLSDADKYSVKQNAEYGGYDISGIYDAF